MGSVGCKNNRAWLLGSWELGWPNSFFDTSDDVACRERAVITASRLGEVLHHLTECNSNCAVAVERRQDAVMPKVLAPSLELLRGLAQCFAEYTGGAK